VDPDPAFNFNLIWIRIRILIKVMLAVNTGFQTLQYSILSLQCEPLKLPDFDFNADPDPAFRSNVDPDPDSKNNVDPPGSGSTTLPSSGGKK